MASKYAFVTFATFIFLCVSLSVKFRDFAILKEFEVVNALDSSTPFVDVELTATQKRFIWRAGEAIGEEEFPPSYLYANCVHIRTEEY